MAKQRKIPNTRVNKFFSNEDYRMEIEMGREALEGDTNFTIVLFRIDRELTTTDDVYGEAGVDEIRYLPPCELIVMPTFDEAENKTYNSDGSLRYLEAGNLTFGIYTQQLKEMNVDLTVGDYVGFAVTPTEMVYYVISDDGRKNWDNKHTIMGYKAISRTVVCSPVDSNEFSGY